MNEVLAEISTPRQDATLVLTNNEGNLAAGVNPAALDHMLHELRQPLSTIDCLAYLLELTSSDDQVREHVHSIQLMVSKAHSILDESHLCFS